MYERCGFDASSSPTTLYMLSDLEARLEDLLSDIAQMPEEYVAKAEKVLHRRRQHEGALPSLFKKIDQALRFRAQEGV